MKNNIFKIVVGVIVIVLILLLIFKGNVKEKTFNQVELTDYNVIENKLFPTYYDTILSVAMQEMKLSGYIVNVRQLTSAAKRQFNGDLKAHIRYQHSNFYLFIEDMGRSESIEVICHEVIHMQQYSSEDLIYNDNGITWKGETLSLNSQEYMDRPWEKDAFDRQTQLIMSVKKSLY
jgi:hypothetical protein